MPRPRVAIIGSGITGLAAAHQLTAGDSGRDSSDRVDVVVYERSDRSGGRLQGSPFAGLDHIDEGADSFLARVPEAVELAREVGLGDDLVHPEPVTAAVWYDGLHPIPDGLLLGVPRRLTPLARSGLLSWRGKARAAIEPVLPRSDTSGDSLGELIRSRFGSEVQDRIVDALVGSIYATDTNRSSLAEIPQIAALATSRSLLLAARRQQPAAGTATAASAPIFAAPRSGIAGLAEAVRSAAVAHGGRLITGSEVGPLERAGESGWLVDGERADAVIIATPAAPAARLLAGVAAESASALGEADTADVVMVTMHVGEQQWPERLRGLSGYLVPKSVQRWVTAVSFGSQKWAHWSPPSGGQILRVSLGRDGLPVLDRDDDQLLEDTLADLETHLGVRFTPREIRITRWKGAFAQYRPHHPQWVRRVEAGLPAGVFVAGSAFRGIGVPACVRDGRAVADLAREVVLRLTDLSP